MRLLTERERAELQAAREAIWFGVIASQNLEGESVPIDEPASEIKLSVVDEFNLAKNLGII